MRSSLRECLELYLVMQSSAAFVYLYHLQFYELQSLHLTNFRAHVLGFYANCCVPLMVT